MRNGRGEADLRKTGAVPGPGSPGVFLPGSGKCPGSPRF
jgi:hypothetical protein